MEVITERLVPNFVVFILVLSFTAVTHGKFKYANDSNRHEISALIPLCLFPLGKRNVSVQTETGFHLVFYFGMAKQEAKKKKKPSCFSRRGNYKLHRKDVELL